MQNGMITTPLTPQNRLYFVLFYYLFLLIIFIIYVVPTSEILIPPPRAPLTCSPTRLPPGLPPWGGGGGCRPLPPS